jgi:kynurenine formamidase
MPRPVQTRMDHTTFMELHARLAAGRGKPPAPAAAAAALVRATALVRTGQVVAAGEPPPAGDAEGEGPGAPYRLRQWHDAGDGWHAVNDRIELDIHGSPSMTHLDALHHFAYIEGLGSGSTSGIEAHVGGIVGRGVLLDIPRATGGRAVPGGCVVTPDDIEITLSSQSVELAPGDTLWLRFGRDHPRSADDVLGAVPAPGLSLACAEWLADVCPALVITDHGLDSVPSEVDGMPVPWHALLLDSLRVPLVDMADLSDVASACADVGRYEFLSVVAPLHLPGASGSPVNPLAIL